MEAILALTLVAILYILLVYVLPIVLVVVAVGALYRAFKRLIDSVRE